MVAELKNINYASSNEHLKIGKNREKGVILHLQMGTTDEGGTHSSQVLDSLCHNRISFEEIKIFQ